MAICFSTDKSHQCKFVLHPVSLNRGEADLDRGLFPLSRFPEVRMRSCSHGRDDMAGRSQWRRARCVPACVSPCGIADSSLVLHGSPVVRPARHPRQSGMAQAVNHKRHSRGFGDQLPIAANGLNRGASSTVGKSVTSLLQASASALGIDDGYFPLSPPVHEQTIEQSTSCRCHWFHIAARSFAVLRSAFAKLAHSLPSKAGWAESRRAVPSHPPPVRQRF